MALLAQAWEEARVDLREACVQLARRARELAGEKSLHEPLCAATEWVIWAYDKGLLSKEHLSLLVAGKVDHSEVYRACASIPECFFRCPEPEANGDRVAYLRSLPFQNGLLFIDRLLNLADMLAPEKRNERGRKRGLVLQGLSEAHLRGKVSAGFFSSGLPEPGTEHSTHGAKVYEAELSAHEPFRTGLADCIARVGLPRWEYMVSGKSLLTFGREPACPVKKRAIAGTPFFYAEDDSSAEWILGQFCNTWCLERVSTEHGSMELENGLWITARRLEIGPTDDGTILFIPRYYSYADIIYRDGGGEKAGQAPRPDDFAPVKCALDRFAHIRLQQSRASKVKRVKLWKAALRRRGRTPREAWDEARRRAGFSPEDMTKEFGERPRK